MRCQQRPQLADVVNAHAAQFEQQVARRHAATICKAALRDHAKLQSNGRLRQRGAEVRRRLGTHVNAAFDIEMEVGRDLPKMGVEDLPSSIKERPETALSQRHPRRPTRRRGRLDANLDLGAGTGHVVLAHAKESSWLPFDHCRRTAAAVR